MYYILENRDGDMFVLFSSSKESLPYLPGYEASSEGFDSREDAVKDMMLRKSYYGYLDAMCNDQTIT